MAFCPFCKTRLSFSDMYSATAYFCNFQPCLIVKEMPRYTAVYAKYPSKLLHQTFFLKNYYIEQNFYCPHTTISKLDVIVLADRINFPKQIIRFPLFNLQKSLDKLSLIITLQ